MAVFEFPNNVLDYFFYELKKYHIKRNENSAFIIPRIEYEYYKPLL